MPGMRAHAFNHNTWQRKAAGQTLSQGAEWKKRDIFTFSYVPLCVCAYECRCLWRRPEVGVRCPAAGVAGSYELPDVGAVN